MKKILVANRGEIALRVMRSARAMGLKTVAVFSEADRESPHVRFADEALCIGPGPSGESYLLGDKIIDAARETGADAIHPGYGFLSENAAFARQVKNAGLVFIGPSPEAIEVMGNKLAAKDAVKAYKIPMVPGIDEAIDNVDQASEIAAKVGYPILIKASAGGGGKGMRVVANAKELPEQMQRAISEAKSAFGNGAVFLEKYIASPRHIEIQVLADTHGNCIHLFERECSIQRRHQKVMEEAPSSVLTAELRDAMGRDAIKVAKACQYTGAGTVEFLLDESLNYYFLEMNTRLQVEHPVTEWITGVDLVEQQIRIARGETLQIKQEDLFIRGHAIELRVYAEDAADNFLPSVGKLTRYRPPRGENIRVDDGFEEGMQIPIYYDPMIAKLITYGKNREAAISRMIEAIGAFEIRGVATTLSFGRFVCRHPAFQSGQFDTRFVERYFNPAYLEASGKDRARVAAALGLELYKEYRATLRPPHVNHSPWRRQR